MRAQGSPLPSAPWLLGWLASASRRKRPQKRERGQGTLHRHPSPALGQPDTLGRGQMCVWRYTGSRALGLFLSLLLSRFRCHLLSAGFGGVSRVLSFVSSGKAVPRTSPAGLRVLRGSRQGCTPFALLPGAPAAAARGVSVSPSPCPSLRSWHLPRSPLTPKAGP